MTEPSQPSQRSREPRRPEPALPPTNPATLLVAALAAAGVGWVLVGRFYADLPPLTWLPAVTIFLLAVVLVITALTTKSRIDRKPGTTPVEPLAVARYAALAKASSVAGAIFTGLYGAVFVYVFLRRDRLTAASDDLPAAALGLGAAVLLVTAALWLERACRIPRRPDDEHDDRDQLSDERR